MEMTLDSVRCAVTKIGKVYHKEHLPVGIPVKRGMVDRAAVNAWWVNRAIPDSRQGLRQALEALRIPKAQMLSEHCLGLNLSDQYWVCPVHSREAEGRSEMPVCTFDTGSTWEQVNFFDHLFSEDVGNLLFGRDVLSDQISLMSPDNTTDG